MTLGGFRLGHPSQSALARSKKNKHWYRRDRIVAGARKISNSNSGSIENDNSVTTALGQSEHSIVYTSMVRL